MGSKPARLWATTAITVTTVALVWASDAVGGFYPGRPTYDYDKYAPTDRNCDDPSSPEFDHGRCGPTDGPVFDSFINTPDYGDERSFFDARRADRSTYTNADPLLEVTHSREVILRIFVDNDANEFFGYKETALNTTVRVELPSPTLAGYDLRAVASISASNATPETVWDTADLEDARRFRIEYVPGSARLLKDNHSTPLSDEIVNRGALISNNGDPGVFAPGFSKEALIELRVKILLVHQNHIALLVGIVCSLIASLLLLIPVTRRFIKRRVSAGWGRFRALGMHVQITANVLAAAVLFVIGWLIKQVVS